MSRPTPPPEKSPDQRGLELLVLGGGGSLPLVGGFVSAAAQQALATAQERLWRQYCTGVDEELGRLKERIGDAEYDTFLARREAAAAWNQAAQLALRTPSAEKHRLLARALLNAATSDADDEDASSLTVLFWSLADRHSALEVRLLAALADPVNSAIDASGGQYVQQAIELDGGPVLGELLSIALPELRHDYVQYAEADDRRCVGQWVAETRYDDALEEDYGHNDVSGPPAPRWLFRHLLDRLAADGLLDSGRGQSTTTDALLDPTSNYLEAIMGGLDGPTIEQIVKGGTSVDFGYTNVPHLGGRYLAFLTAEPVWPPETPQA